MVYALTTNLLIAFVLGILPVSEIRGGVLYVFATSNDMYSAIQGLATSLLGNLLVPFIAYKLLDLLDTAFKSKYTPNIIKKIYLLILEYSRRKTRNISGKGYAALIVFVAIPFPATGAWTGTLVAYVLGFNRKKAILAIELGVLIATIIVTFTVFLGIGVLKHIFLL
jgi:uncharacterized membrane protein